ncbi:MAG: helix-turn-helix transcriptional regulator [Mariniphaga sp.]|nr:helix-turn-helix transcriptional regulator [Mariniphaga sp.]
MNKIEKIIKSKEHGCFVFKPDREFYNMVGINRKRFGQIYRGEISPTVTEAKALANYFQVEVTELI